MLYLSWIVAFSYSSIWLFNTRTVAFSYHNHTYYQCYNEGLNDWQKKVVMTYNFVFTYALPFFAIAFSYLSITKKLLNDSMANNEAPIRRSTQIRTKAKVRLVFGTEGLTLTPLLLLFGERC